MMEFLRSSSLDSAFFWFPVNDFGKLGLNTWAINGCKYFAGNRKYLWEKCKYFG